MFFQVSIVSMVLFPLRKIGCNLSVDRFFHGKLFPLLLMLVLHPIQ